MKLSHRWLMRHIPSLPAPHQVIPILEQMGLEVAGTEFWGEDYGMVELVEVVEREPHPDADHLNLVTVARGSGERTMIVTGASNGFVGERLWYAPPETRLPDGRVLETRPLRGIESPGMLLSPEELGYQAGTGDLWVWDGPEPLGTTFLDVVGGRDTVYELELTPNVAVFLQSVAAIAQQVAAILGLSMTAPAAPYAFGHETWAEVDAPDRAPLYGLVSMTLKPGATSPLWLQTLLRAIGLRIIHPAVDVTNFVLWDLGEPLHAFDRDRVALPIVVRKARPAEELVALDKTVLILTEEDLVIADQKGALALAGVMGGAESAVSSSTREILLESAHFTSDGIFKSMRHHQLPTDAAGHFARGTNPEMVFKAPSVVQSLLAESGVLESVGASVLVGTLADRRRIRLNGERIRAILGTDWADDVLWASLEALEYGRQHDLVEIPRGRHDVEGTHDLAEDVARFRGLEEIQSRLPVGTVVGARDHEAMFYERLRDTWAESGFTEVVTRSFSSGEREETLLGHETHPVAITNPLREEERVLRTVLLPGLLDVLRYNRARRDQPVRVFEVAPVFARIPDGVSEKMALAAVMTLDPVAGFPPHAPSTVFDLKGTLDWSASRLGFAFSYRETDALPPYLHPGRALALVQQGQVVGYLGELRPRVAERFRARRVAVLEMTAELSSDLRASVVRRPSRFPEVVRDLSLVLPEGVPYARLRKVIEDMEVETLREMTMTDEFVGDFGRSVTVRLTFQSYQDTLTDETVDSHISRILEAIATMGAVIRQ